MLFQFSLHGSLPDGWSGAPRAWCGRRRTPWRHRLPAALLRASGSRSGARPQMLGASAVRIQRFPPDLRPGRWCAGCSSAARICSAFQAVQRLRENLHARCGDRVTARSRRRPPHHRSGSIQVPPVWSTCTSNRLMPHLSGRSLATQTWSASSTRRPRPSGVASGILRIAASSIPEPHLSVVAVQVGPEPEGAVGLARGLARRQGAAVAPFVSRCVGAALHGSDRSSTGSPELRLTERPTRTDRRGPHSRWVPPWHQRPQPRGRAGRNSLSPRHASSRRRRAGRPGRVHLARGGRSTAAFRRRRRATPTHGTFESP